MMVSPAGKRDSLTDTCGNFSLFYVVVLTLKRSESSPDFEPVTYI